jgi:hypothetical protein
MKILTNWVSSVYPPLGGVLFLAGNPYDILCIYYHHFKIQIPLPSFFFQNPNTLTIISLTNHGIHWRGRPPPTTTPQNPQNHAKPSQSFLIQIPLGPLCSSKKLGDLRTRLMTPVCLCLLPVCYMEYVS